MPNPLDALKIDIEHASDSTKLEIIKLLQADACISSPELHTLLGVPGLDEEGVTNEERKMGAVGTGYECGRCGSKRSGLPPYTIEYIRHKIPLCSDICQNAFAMENPGGELSKKLYQSEYPEGAVDALLTHINLLAEHGSGAGVVTCKFLQDLWPFALEVHSGNNQ